MNDEELITLILDESFKIHKAIGPGLLENVYKQCLAYKLRKNGLYVESEKPIPVIYEEVKMDCGYRADLVVENMIIVETKNVEANSADRYSAASDPFTLPAFKKRPYPEF